MLIHPRRESFSFMLWFIVIVFLFVRFHFRTPDEHLFLVFKYSSFFNGTLNGVHSGIVREHRIGVAAE